MIAPRHLEELGSDLHIIDTILNDLLPSFTRVVLRPGVSIKTISLVARVARSCARQRIRWRVSRSCSGLTYG